jgi:hypothetical protein
MEAMYDTIEARIAGAPPIGAWRRTYVTRESEIVGVLVEAGTRFPGVAVGSYPTFDQSGSQVEIVLKSSDAAQLAAAAAYVSSVLDT